MYHLFTAQNSPNACDSEPCQNGATCVQDTAVHILLALGLRPYRCNCPTRFIGDQCQTGKLFAYCGTVIITC